MSMLITYLLYFKTCLAAIFGLLFALGLWLIDIHFIGHGFERGLEMFVKKDGSGGGDD